MQGPPIPPEEMVPQAPPGPTGPTGPAGPTLGDVGAQMQPPQGGMPDDLPASLEKWRAYFGQQAMKRRREPMPDAFNTSPGKVLANVLTFGMAGLAHHDYAQGYNRGVEQYNAKLAAQVDDDAMKMVGLEGQRALSLANANRADLGLQLQLLNTQMRAQQDFLAEIDRRRDRERQQTGDQYGRTYAPPTEEQGVAARERGYDYVPNPQFPGRFDIKPRGDASGVPAPTGVQGAPQYQPPAPDSPLGGALGGSAPAPVGSAAAPAASGPPNSFAELRARRADEKRAEEAAAQSAKPLEGEDRKVVAGMLRMRQLTQRALTEFTPAERAKFVGVLRQPANRAAQLVRSDPRFQQWSALTGQMQTLRFELAGAALTKTESAVLESFLPTGNEWGGADEFDTKAQEFYRSALGAMKSRMQASKGRGSLEQEIEAAPAEIGAGAATPTTDAQPQAPPSTAPTSPAAPRRMTLDEFLAEP